MEALIRSPRMLSEFYMLGVKSQEKKSTASGAVCGTVRSVNEGVSVLIEVPDDIRQAVEKNPSGINTENERSIKNVGDEQLRDMALRVKMMEEGLEAAREASEKVGFESGYAQGLIRGEQAQAEQLQKLCGMANGFGAALGEQITGVEDLVVDIVFESTCKILGDALVERHAVVAMVKEALSKVEGGQKVVIRVSPDDFALLTEKKSALLSGGDRQKGLDVVADDRVALGGCLVETGSGTLDARLEIQLQALRDTLLAARRSLPE